MQSFFASLELEGRRLWAEGDAMGASANVLRPAASPFYRDFPQSQATVFGFRGFGYLP